MLTKLIREMLEPLMEVILWLSLIGALIGGANINGFWGAFAGLLTWLLVSILFVGLALIIVDIRNIVRRIDGRQSQGET